MRGWLEGWLVGCRSCSRARMLACSLGESVGSGGRVPEGFVGLTGLRLPCSVSACDCVCLGCVCVGRSPLKDRLVTFLSLSSRLFAFGWRAAASQLSVHAQARLAHAAAHAVTLAHAGAYRRTR